MHVARSLLHFDVQWLLYIILLRLSMIILTRFILVHFLTSVYRLILYSYFLLKKSHFFPISQDCQLTKARKYSGKVFLYRTQVVLHLLVLGRFYIASLSMELSVITTLSSTRADYGRTVDVRASRKTQPFAAALVTFVIDKLSSVLRI